MKCSVKCHAWLWDSSMGTSDNPLWPILRPSYTEQEGTQKRHSLRSTSWIFRHRLMRDESSHDSVSVFHISAEEWEKRSLVCFYLLFQMGITQTVTAATPWMCLAYPPRPKTAWGRSVWRCVCVCVCWADDNLQTCQLATSWASYQTVSGFSTAEHTDYSRMEMRGRL